MPAEQLMSDLSNQYPEFDRGRIVRETFVERVHFFETIESTNDAALEHCRKHAFSEPMLFLAAQQTAGRGRGTNRWWSMAGALTFSVVIRPTDWGLSQESWPKASLTTGLAICRALDPLLPDGAASLKWPNDIHLDGRKVSGVLVEVPSPMAGTLVIGIGLNVNNSFDEAPDELRDIATSLIDVSGEETGLTDVLIQLLVELEHQWSRLAAGDAALVRDWQRRCALKGKSVEVGTGGRPIRGVCHGIDGEGALLVRTDEGIEQVFGGVVSQIGSTC